MQKYTKSKERTKTELFMETFGIVFGTTGPGNIQNRPEKILILFLSLGAILASTFCSGLLFKRISTIETEPTILTLSDLGASVLKITYPQEMYMLHRSIEALFPNK